MADGVYDPDADGDDDTNDLDDAQDSSEPASSKAWLALITHAEKEFKDYHHRADNIDKLYASLTRLASETRDRQFQMFWANVQVLNPAVYSRVPVPVVVPRFQDSRPLPRTASEILERASTVAIELTDLDGTMRMIRDDLIILARGCAWLRYEKKKDSDTDHERVCIEYVHRQDFLHDPARSWPEVDWVAKRSWLTKEQMRDRFKDTSGDAYDDASYAVIKDVNGNNDGAEKAGVWEIWSKSGNDGKGQVVWVTEGVEVLLDDGEPHLDLSGFFPCPRPAYSTCQRGSLIPVPDMAFYKDQLEEINELTARISALTEAVKLRGFYPSGAGEIGDAVEAAVKTQSDNVVLIPVANWGMVGSGSAKDMIVWLPLDMIVKAISELVALRKNLIDDVYQITGLSDIMRGDTVASETLGAQQLKSQYGSIRIRNRQEELVRIARDMVRIAAEIMAENFQGETLLDMAQMELPTDAEIAKQVKPLEGQIKQIESHLKAEIEQAKRDPQLQQMAAQNPEKAQQVVQQITQQVQEQVQGLQHQIEQLNETVTINDVTKMLRDQRLRPFMLDIETDSTITPDENAQKQRVTEYVQAMSNIFAQAIPALQAMPQAAPLLAGTIKFVQKQFRVGREMDQTVDEFVNAMKAMAGQPKPPNPQQAEIERQAQRDQAELALKQGDQKINQTLAQARLVEAQAKVQESSARVGALNAGVQQKGAELQIRGQGVATDAQAKSADAQTKAAQAYAAVSAAQAQQRRDDEAHQQSLMTEALRQDQIRAQTEQARAKAAGEMAKANSTMIPIPLGQF